MNVRLMKEIIFADQEDVETQSVDTIVCAQKDTNLSMEAESAKVDLHVTRFS